MEKIGRRKFVKLGAAGLALAASSRLTFTGSPADKINVGVIGCGRQGLINMRDFLKQPDVTVAAVCDVYEPHLNKAVSTVADKEQKAEPYKDFRRILDRKDIDAVVISTPDHWHALQTVWACQAGKDVYVEKPIATSIVEGRKMVEAARRYNRVVQVGTQQRSAEHFQKVVELIRGGAIGQISEVRTWNFGNDFPDGIGNPADSNSPDGLDWDLWLGPAKKVPFNTNRFGIHPNRWSTFRWFWDYAGGMMTDWGVHWIDIVQWAMNVEGPTKVSASGGKFGLRDNRETPDTLEVIFQYPTFIMTYSNRELNGHGPIISEALGHKGGGITFHGTMATLFVDRRGYEIIPERKTGPNGSKTVELQLESLSMEGVDRHERHVRNFIDCMTSRQRSISDIEFGHTSTNTCHLGNIAYRSGQSIIWDIKTEKIHRDPDASKLLSREYRKPWKL